MRDALTSNQLLGQGQTKMRSKLFFGHGICFVFFRLAMPFFLIDVGLFCSLGAAAKYNIKTTLNLAVVHIQNLRDFTGTSKRLGAYKRSSGSRWRRQNPCRSVLDPG